MEFGLRQLIVVVGVPVIKADLLVEVGLCGIELAIAGIKLLPGQNIIVIGIPVAKDANVLVEAEGKLFVLDTGGTVGIRWAKRVGYRRRGEERNRNGSRREWLWTNMPWSW